VLAEMDSLPNRELLPVVMITGDPDRSVRQRALERGAKDFIAKPFDNVEIVLRVRNLLETRQLQVELKARNLVLEEEVSERTAELTAAIERLSRSQAELQLAQRETIERLGMAAEFHDYETATHIRRMSTYCGMLSRWAGLEERLAASIEVASGLHDVGKIGIPDSILRKPGPLTKDEMNLMREHTVIGNRILTGSKSEVIERAALIALTHHERPDGSGYPNGLRGHEIPIEGCIAAIADVFDALTSDRVYRPAISVEDSLRMMEDGRGSQFDARLLDLFFEHISEVLAARSL
jgi:putative two-component system response regulator